MILIKPGDKTAVHPRSRKAKQIQRASRRKTKLTTESKQRKKVKFGPEGIDITNNSLFHQVFNTFTLLLLVLKAKWFKDNTSDDKNYSDKDASDLIEK